MAEPPDDPSALALIMDDCYAPAFLVWWDKRGCLGNDLNEAAIACRASPSVVAGVKLRCEMAGLLVDDGITDLARKFVQATVGHRLRGGKRGK